VPRRSILFVLLAAALLAPAAASAQSTTAAPSCPSFQVLNDDKIGSLSLPAGAYQITVGTPSTLSCAAASDLFRQFLEDFDGRLSGGWSVTVATATFSRSTPRSQSFSVARTGATPPAGGATYVPPSGGTCPATFQVLHDDHIGELAIPAGNYRLNLVAAGRMTCDQAAVALAQFLQDYDGTLPAPWVVDQETGTFLKGSPNVGFWIEPMVGPPPSQIVLKLPGDGTPCPGTFSVLHNDMIGALDVPKGAYLFVPLAGSSLSCPQVVSLIRQFLAAPHNKLPKPWVVNPKTGTMTKGKGSKVGFRMKPAAAN
jgi:hypothetical protein